MRVVFGLEGCVCRGRVGWYKSGVGEVMVDEGVR